MVTTRVMAVMVSMAAMVMAVMVMVAMVIMGIMVMAMVKNQGIRNRNVNRNGCIKKERVATLSFFYFHKIKGFMLPFMDRSS